MKADKGNCFVVTGNSNYDEKMESLPNDKKTYELISKPPLGKIERELNSKLLVLKKQEKINENKYRYLHSTNAIPPAIQSSIKHHKANHPLRPIVTFIGSAIYNKSKFLANILSPPQNKNGYSVSNYPEFGYNVVIETTAYDETIISFDVVSVLTSTPVELCFISTLRGPFPLSRSSKLQIGYRAWFTLVT